MVLALGVFDDIVMIIAAGVLVTSIVTVSLKLSGDLKKLGFSLALFTGLAGVSLLLRNLPGLGFTGYEEALGDLGNVIFIIGSIIGVYAAATIERHAGSSFGGRRGGY